MDKDYDRRDDSKLPPVRLYRELEHGEQLVVAADPSEGASDYCAAAALSKRHLDCPFVYNDRTDSTQFGYELYNFCKYIFNKTGMWPRLAVERNTGQATISTLKLLNYPYLFRMIDFAATASTEGGDIGWVTTGSWSAGELVGTRRKMLDDLALAIKQKRIKMYDEEQIRQIMAFRWYRGGGRQQSNKKDDLLFATGIAWQLQLVTPEQYLDDFSVEEFKKEQEKWRFK